MTRRKTGQGADGRGRRSAKQTVVRYLRHLDGVSSEIARGDTSRISELRAALSHRMPAVRAHAADLVDQVGDKSSVPRLISLLRDSSAEVRMRAAEALGTLVRDGRATQPLIKALGDRSELVRICAAEALGDIGDSRGLPALRRALRDRSDLVRRYTAIGIGMLGHPEEVPRLRRHLGRERSDSAQLGFYAALFRLGEPAVLPQILGFLGSRDYRVRCAAANISGELIDQDNLGLLREALRYALRHERTVAGREALESNLKLLDEKAHAAVARRE